MYIRLAYTGILAYILASCSSHGETEELPPLSPAVEHVSVSVEMGGDFSSQRSDTVDSNSPIDESAVSK